MDLKGGGGVSKMLISAFLRITTTKKSFFQYKNFEINRQILYYNLVPVTVSGNESKSLAYLSKRG